MNDPIPVMPLNYSPANQLRANWIRLPVVALACMITAWTIGASTNAINGCVSMFYFQTIVGWMYGQMTLGDVVWQGLMESTVFGVIFMITFSVTYAAATSARCRLKFVFHILALAVIVTLVLWTLAGMVGWIWASLSPNSFLNSFPGIPSDVPSLRGWAWVGGSIWGVYAGGFLSIIGGPIALHFYWRRVREREARLSAVA